MSTDQWNIPDTASAATKPPSKEAEAPRRESACNVEEAVRESEVRKKTATIDLSVCDARISASTGNLPMSVSEGGIVPVDVLPRPCAPR